MYISLCDCSCWTRFSSSHLSASSSAFFTRSALSSASKSDTGDDVDGPGPISRTPIEPGTDNGCSSIPTIHVILYFPYRCFVCFGNATVSAFCTSTLLTPGNARFAHALRSERRTLFASRPSPVVDSLYILFNLYIVHDSILDSFVIMYLCETPTDNRTAIHILPQ